MCMRDLIYRSMRRSSRARVEGMRLIEALRGPSESPAKAGTPSKRSSGVFLCTNDSSMSPANM